jgi:hypothetical protein
MSSGLILNFIFKGNLVDELEILAHLKYILSLNEPRSEHPLGVLTTADRDTWTRSRIQILNAGKSLLGFFLFLFSFSFLIFLAW